MKRLLLMFTVIFAVFQPLSADEGKPWRYVDATDLRIINKGWDNTSATFQRLPSYMQDSVRTDLWDRMKNSSGIAVRFATNSTRVGVKYQLLNDFHMIHMADTGTKGTDLYIWEGDSVWRHANTNRPYVNNKEEKICEATYLENLDGEMHEYMIYLPLYDGVNWLQVKIDEDAEITGGNPELIRSDLKIVAYGTSILQGGCASRPGMASSNILSRELNCEVVNLAVSGEGKMDYCMARLMAGIDDADVYLIDPVPNCTAMMCDTLTYDFVNILRKARPEARIVMLEGPMYPYSRYNSYFRNYLPEKNANYRRNYERLKAENPRNLYYVTCENLDGVEDDGTVDGIHLTDLGFRHYADKLAPVLAEALDAKPKIVAHRGLWKADGSAQNSVTALRLAAEAGCYASEFDVWLTADSVLVVNHDPTYKGVTIQDAKAREVLALPLANGECIPTLESYLTEAEKHTGLKLVLELKPHRDMNREDYAAARVLEALDRHGLRDRTVIISFSINACLAFRKLDPAIEIQYLGGDLSPSSIKGLKLNGIDYSMGTMRKHPEWAQEAREKGLVFNVWTINTLDQLEEFLPLQPDYITTNDPVEHLKRLK